MKKKFIIITIAILVSCCSFAQQDSGRNKRSPERQQPLKKAMDTTEYKRKQNPADSVMNIDNRKPKIKPDSLPPQHHKK